MSKIVVPNTSITFLLQATKILHKGSYTIDDLNVIFNFINNINDDIINEYINNGTILSYDNDLELFIEIMDKVLLIFEAKEEYEKCHVIKNKKIKCLNFKSENYEKSV